MSKAKSPIPEGFHSITLQLTTERAGQAIEWYKNAFGAREASRSVGPDGKIMHAELWIGNSPVMVNDDIMGNKGPKAYGGSPASLWIYVDDCDRLFKRAINAGAQPAAPPMDKVQDQFWGDRTGMLTDPYGYRWTIATRKEDLTRHEIQRRQDEWMKQLATR